MFFYHVWANFKNGILKLLLKLAYCIYYSILILQTYINRVDTNSLVFFDTAHVAS